MSMPTMPTVLVCSRCGRSTGLFQLKEDSPEDIYALKTEAVCWVCMSPTHRWILLQQALQESAQLKPTVIRVNITARNAYILAHFLQDLFQQKGDIEALLLRHRAHMA